MSGISHCTGRVEASMPSEPVISIQELARSMVAASNQRLKPVSGAIRQAPTPMPIITRAASSQAKLPATENARQPSTARLRNHRITRFGPYRSSQLPSGNCIAAKPRK